MARPKKQGMEYFPHDCDAWEDPKIKALRKKHGNDGYTFYFHLLEIIYKSPNYEFAIDDEIMIVIISDDLNISEDKFFEILDTCFRFKLFDKNRYEKDKILTSNGIKKRSFPVEKKRQKRREYYQNNDDKNDVEKDKISDTTNNNNNVLGNDKPPSYEVSDTTNEVSDTTNEVSDTTKYTKESKVKESKVKESKEEKRREEKEKKKSPSSQKKIIDDFFQKNLKKNFEDIRKIIRLDFSFSDVEIDNIIIAWFLNRKQNEWKTKSKNPIKIRADNMLNDLISWFTKEMKLNGKNNGKSNAEKLEKIKEIF